MSEKHLDMLRRLKLERELAARGVAQDSGRPAEIAEYESPKGIISFIESYEASPIKAEEHLAYDTPAPRKESERRPVKPEIVTQTVIAARTGVSHAAVYLWQKRHDFPEPFPCAGKGRFYSWDEVLEWYAGYSKNNETGETDEQVQG